ncbi:hypothetical protein BH23ACT9_BH23ACT9_25300 [soil metagenome]
MLDAEPVAAGPARGVTGVHPADPAGRAALHLPVHGLQAVGGLVHLSTVGPLHARPGDLEDPVAHPLRGVSELTVLLAGHLEHRDSLGNRGRLDAPAARLVAGGGGLLTEVGPSRDLRRDGGDLQVVTLRWLAAAGATVPTTRLATDPPVRAQGRSTITRWLGPDASLPTPDGLTVRLVRIAAGSSVDLDVGTTDDVLVAVIGGTVLTGADLQPVTAPASAVLPAGEARLQLATHLEGERAAVVVVVTAPALAGEVVHRDGLLAAASDQQLDEVLQQARSGAFGSLPGLDG